MKVRDVLRILENHGFRRKRWKGSHQQFEGVVNGQRRLVTVAGKEGGRGAAADARIDHASVRTADPGVPEVNQEGAAT